MSEREEGRKSKSDSKQSKNEKKNTSRSKKFDDGGESSETDEDLKAIEESRLRNTSCFVKGCNSYSKLLLQLCEYCHEKFCFAHLQPEVHGCGDAAKRAARHNFKAPPALKPSDEDREVASTKLKEKVAQLTLERKRQPK